MVVGAVRYRTQSGDHGGAVLVRENGKVRVGGVRIEEAYERLSPTEARRIGFLRPVVGGARMLVAPDEVREGDVLRYEGEFDLVVGYELGEAVVTEVVRRDSAELAAAASG